MKYEIMMSCGHEDTVELFGKEKERDRKIEYFKELSKPDIIKALENAK